MDHPQKRAPVECDCPRRRFNLQHFRTLPPGKENPGREEMCALAAALKSTRGVPTNANESTREAVSRLPSRKNDFRPIRPPPVSRHAGGPPRLARGDCGETAELRIASWVLTWARSPVFTARAARARFSSRAAPPLFASARTANLHRPRKARPLRRGIPSPRLGLIVLGCTTYFGKPYHSGRISNALRPPARQGKSRFSSFLGYQFRR